MPDKPDHDYHLQIRASTLPAGRHGISNATIALLLIFSGGLVAVGVLIPQMWIVSVAGLLLFFYCLYRTPHEELKLLCMRGALFGTAYCGGTIIWFWHVLPLDWLGVSSPVRSVLLLLFFWGIVSLSLGLFFGIYAILFARHKTGSIFTNAIFGSALWTITQYAQLWGFSIITAGSESLFGAHFSPIMTGYALSSFSPALWLASLGGIYALTFSIVCIAFTAFGIISRYARTNVRMITAIVIATIVIGALTYADAQYPLIRFSAPSDASLNVALVSTAFPAETLSDDEQRRRANVQHVMLDEWLSKNPAPDILVFPEAAAFFDSLKLTYPEFISTLSSEKAFAIIDSQAIPGEKSRVVRMRAYDGEAPRDSGYDKVFLVPEGEYSPWVFSIPLRLIGGGNFFKTLEKQHFLERGSEVRPLEAFGTSLGALFCSDILSPRLYRAVAGQGATILINAASQSLFHDSKLTDAMVMNMARVRAVETDRYLLLAGNSLPSAIISNRGEVVARASRGENTILGGTVPTLTTQTPYVRFGDTVVLIPLVIILLHIAVRLRPVKWPPQNSA